LRSASSPPVRFAWLRNGGVSTGPKPPNAIREDLDRASSLIAIQPEIGTRARNVKLSGVRRVHLTRIRYDLYYRVVEERGSSIFWLFGTPAVVPDHRSKKLDTKIRVSVPDDVFAKGERLARRSKPSLGELFSAALSEYVARHESTDYAAHSAFSAAAT
jgi:hypothetical protein